MTDQYGDGSGPDARDTIPLRPPPPPRSSPPSPQLRSRQCVRIRHPAYHNSTNTLLSLPSADCSTTLAGDVMYGVHYRTVHTACAIIANNRFDGWIARDQDGQEKMELEDIKILPGADYWFFVPPLDIATSPYAYPIVPVFRKWSFPNSIPSSFSSASTEPGYVPPGSSLGIAGVRQRDVFCRLTGHIDAVDCAHIVPKSEENWWLSNNVSQYNEAHANSLNGINTLFNGILLRKDVHSLWDNMHFSIVPKAQVGGVWALAVHVLNDLSPSVHQNYHNMYLHTTKGVSPAALFARFAWDIFPHVLAFMRGGQARWLAVRLQNGETQVKQFSAQECARMCEKQGIGRSFGSKKRSRGNEEAEQIDSGISADEDENWDDYLMREFEREEEEEEENRWEQGEDVGRGRKKLRRCDRFDLLAPGQSWP